MLVASLKFYKYIIVSINFLNIESVLLLRDAKLHINRPDLNDFCGRFEALICSTCTHVRHM